jgi:hypothetical protein
MLSWFLTLLAVAVLAVSAHVISSPLPVHTWVAYYPQPAATASLSPGNR